jgi:hypothetical protein
MTRSEKGLKRVGRFHTPAFCLQRLRVKPFAPADAGDTSTAVFLHWLPVQSPDPDDAGQEAMNVSTEPLEAWDEAAGTDELGDLLDGQPAALVALAKWFWGHRPRREVVFVGHALQRCEHGPGLRIIAKPRGGTATSDFWWASDLPGPPLSAEADEAEARHALAIQAAAWARSAAGLP